MRRLSRRALLAGLVGSVALAGAAYVVAVPASAETLTPAQAFEAVEAGDILLVDVRRPEEWQETGIAQGAQPIDMRRPDFIEAVLAARQSPDQPIALICARGVRSARTAARLTEAGLTPIIDIPEGMLGSFAGPGWLGAELPLMAWDRNG
ncbi:MAG: rhodanese-like domain-containing protein [Pseudomonadota bacterium]